MSEEFRLTKIDADVLKNFASINDIIIFREGNILKTISKGRDVFCQYKFEGGEFDRNYFIYILKDFIVGITAFLEPYLTFDKEGKFIYINSDEPKAKIRYTVSDYKLAPSNYKESTDKEINFPNVDITINVTSIDIKTWKKMAASFGLEVVNISKKAGENEVTVSLLNDKNNNCYSQVFKSDDIDSECNVNFNPSSLMMMGLDYTIEISKEKISRWTSVDYDLVYFVMMS